MIISSQQIQTVLRLYGVSQAKRPEEQCSSGEPQEVRGENVDRAELSEEARLYQRVREAAYKAPEVREDRVKKIKEAVENGTYAVSAEAVAEKMLERFTVLFK